MSANPQKQTPKIEKQVEIPAKETATCAIPTVEEAADASNHLKSVILNLNKVEQ